MFALCLLAGRDRRHAHRDRGRSRISIHAPLAGRDANGDTQEFTDAISIHAPHAGRDIIRGKALGAIFTFQSTRPMRGATVMAVWMVARNQFQSTRPMRGATPWRRTSAATFCIFQSTRPMQGATCTVSRPQHQQWISIHAPHAGRDHFVTDYAALIGISIHAPHAGRDGIS